MRPIHPDELPRYPWLIVAAHIALIALMIVAMTGCTSIAVALGDDNGCGGDDLTSSYFALIAEQEAVVDGYANEQVEGGPPAPSAELIVVRAANAAVQEFVERCGGDVTADLANDSGNDHLVGAARLLIR